MMTINKHTYRTTRVKNDKSSLNQISFFISLVSFSYLAYILLYFYDTGFLNYHGIPSDFVEISIENICNFLIIIFAVFGGIIIISLSSILIKDITAYKITLCIGIGTLIIISYYCYKIFANFDLFISNYSNEKFINHLYSSYSTAFIIVVFVTSLIVAILNQISVFFKKVKHLTWNEFLKKYTPTINIEYTIKILILFLLSVFICCCFAFQLGKLNAEKYTYHIGYYQKQQLALIKTMKNGIGIFIQIDKNKKYNKGHFLLLQLGENSIKFTEKSKIIQN